MKKLYVLILNTALSTLGFSMDASDSASAAGGAASSGGVASALVETHTDESNFERAVGELRGIVASDGIDLTPYAEQKADYKGSKTFEKYIYEQKTLIFNNKTLIKDEILKRKPFLVPFLLRSYNSADFAGGNLIANVHEHFFYTLLEAVWGTVPFRGYPEKLYCGVIDQSSKSFYISHTTVNLMESRYRALVGGSCDFLYMDFIKSERLEGYADVPMTRKALCDFECGQALNVELTKPILIIPFNSGGHSTLTIHVLDHENKRVHASLFFNTSRSDLYHEAEKNFNRTGCYKSYIKGLEDMKERFPEVDIDSLRSGQCGIKCDWKIPFIDCSYDLQTETDDVNCTLYSYNYAVAVNKLLKDTGVLSDVQKLARRIFDSADADEDAVIAIQTIFRERIKAHLPQYYNGDGERKSFEEVKEHHMRMRWELSKEWIERFFG